MGIPKRAVDAARGQALAPIPATSWILEMDLCRCEGVVDWGAKAAAGAMVIARNAKAAFMVRIEIEMGADLGTGKQGNKMRWDLFLNSVAIVI